MAVLLGGALLAACSSSSSPATGDAGTPNGEPGPVETVPTPTGAPVVLVGAGDIASCSSTDDDATAALVDGIQGTVFVAGDNAYETGAETEYTSCFEPTWGKHKARIKPSPGNHEYYSANAGPYYRYFGAAAGDPAKGYYSYDLGDWHVVSLNSNCDYVGGCDAGSAQEQWLRADLARNKKGCTVAYWHHPRFSSGFHGNDTTVSGLWQALYDNDADLIINGHDHNYERFAPQDPQGQADAVRGIRQIVVGTGGRDLRAIGAPVANSEVRNADSFGVIKLTLSATGYDWEFVPTPGGTLKDSGSGRCH